MSLDFNNNKASRPSFTTNISSASSTSPSIPLSSFINTTKKSSFSSNTNVANNNSTTGVNSNNTGDSDSLFGMTLCKAAEISSIPTIISYNDSYILYLNLPSIIRITIDFLINNDCYEKEGIFRVSGSMKRINQLQESFIENPKFNLYQMNNNSTSFNDQLSVFDVATLLKRYLNALPNSIVPKSIFKDIRSEIFSKPLYKDLLSFSNNANDIPSLNIFKETENVDSTLQTLKAPINEILTFMASIYYTRLDPTNMDVFLFILKFLSLLSMDGNYQRTKMNSFNLAKIFQLAFFLSNDHHVDLSSKYSNLHSSAIMNKTLGHSVNNGKVSLASISGPTAISSGSAVVDDDEDVADDNDAIATTSTAVEANPNVTATNDDEITNNINDENSTLPAVVESKTASSNGDSSSAIPNNSNLFFNHSDFSFESFNSISADYNLNQLLLKILIDNFDGFLALLFEKYQQLNDTQKDDRKKEQRAEGSEPENEGKFSEENQKEESCDDIDKVLKQVFVKKSWYESNFGTGSSAANFDDSGISKISDEIPFYNKDDESTFSNKKERAHRRKSKLNFMSIFNGMGDIEREIAYEAKHQQKEQQRQNKLQYQLQQPQHMIDISSSASSHDKNESATKDSIAAFKPDGTGEKGYDDAEEIVPLKSSVSSNAIPNASSAQSFLQKHHLFAGNGNDDSASLSPRSISITTTTTQTNASLSSSHRKKKEYDIYPVDKSSGRVSVFNIFTPPPKKSSSKHSHHKYNNINGGIPDNTFGSRCNSDNKSIHSNVSSSVHTTRTTITISKPDFVNPATVNSAKEAENSNGLSRRRSMLSPFLGGSSNSPAASADQALVNDTESIKQSNNIKSKKSHKMDGAFKLVNFMISSKSMSHIPTSRSKQDITLKDKDESSKANNAGILDHQPEMTQVEDGDVTISESIIGDNTLNGSEPESPGSNENSVANLNDEFVEIALDDKTHEKSELGDMKKAVSEASSTATATVKPKEGFFSKKKRGSKKAEEKKNENMDKSGKVSNSGNGYMKKRFSNWFTTPSSTLKE